MSATRKKQKADAVRKYLVHGLRLVPLHVPVFDAAGNRAGCSCGRDVCTPQDKSGGRSAGKHPRVKEWQKSASANPVTVRRWFEKWPDSNVGIALGRSGGTGAGVVAVDVDGAGGEALLLELSGGDLPATVEVVSGNGRRLLYAIPRDLAFDPKTTPVPAAGGGEVRAQGTGAQAVMPPSLHYSGKRYEWAPGRALGDIPMAPMPGWLIELMAPPAPPTAPPPGPPRSPSGGGDDALLARAAAYLDRMPAAVSGQGGHGALFAAARAMAYSFDLGPAAAFDLLMARYNPRCSPPWTEKEVEHKVRDADEKPFNHPRGHLRDAPPPGGGGGAARPTFTPGSGGSGGGGGAAAEDGGRGGDDGPGGGGQGEGEGGGGKKKDKAPPAAEVLAGIGLQADLFHDAGGVAYATFGRRTYPVRSRAFRLHLVGEYRKLTGKVPNSDAVGAALNAVEAAAVHDNPERPAFVRIAGHAGAIYYHLGDDETTVIEIDAGGWRVCDDPPVRFVKPSGMLAVPMPERGGDFADVRRFLNCPDAAAFALFRGWVSAAFNPDGPYPVLCLTGEQGSAKSTTSRVAKSLVDPNKAPVRTAPREERDLMIAAAGCRVLAFDNISTLPDWLSDAFCRLATGGGFSARTLYADAEETVFEAKRPVVVNGIEDFATRPDLLERAVLLRHPAIPDNRRRLESELWAEFEAARPKLLGAVLDRVSAGLRALPAVDKTRLPRMADACAFAAACELGMGEEAEFLVAFRANQRDGHDLALADSPVVAPLLALMTDRDEWCGTPTALYEAASARVPDPKPRDWPKKPNAFTGKLRRVVPSLARVHGLDVDTDAKDTGSDRTRRVRVARRQPDGGRGTPSGPSAPSGGGPACPPPDDPPGGPGRSSAEGPSGANPRKTSVSDGPDGPDDVFPLPPEASQWPPAGRRFRNDDRPEESR